VSLGRRFKTQTGVLGCCRSW